MLRNLNKDLAMRIRRLSHSAFAFLLLLLPWCAGMASAQGIKNSGPPQIAVDQTQYVAYWTDEPNWHSELQLRNNSVSDDLIVTPSLRSADGAETTLPQVAIKPQEVASIDLQQAVAAANPKPSTAYGSLVVRYKAYSQAVLYAALMVHRMARPIAFHIDGAGQLEQDSDAFREGIWWMPTAAIQDYLVLTNQGDDVMPLVVSLYDAGGHAFTKQLTLPGRQMVRYSVKTLLKGSGLSGRYGGITVHALAHARALDTIHVLYDEVAGFSALLKMFDHDPRATPESRDYAKRSQWILRAPMLALSNPDPALAFPSSTTLKPKLFLRNVTATPVTASLTFHWRSASGQGDTTGPTIRILTNQTQEVDFFTLPDNQVPPRDAYWSTVTLTTDGKPDGVVAVAASYDDSLKYGAQTPFSDQLSSRWEGGEWQADALHDSITTVGNGGAKEMRAAFTLFYNRGTERYDLEQTLEPNEQMWVDIGSLISSSMPDIHGKVLPKTLTTGSYQFRDLTSTLVGSLFEGKVIYDLTNGHVSYGCGTCCSTSSVYLNYSPLNLGLTNNFTNGVTTQDNCGDSPQDDSGDFYNWTTANTSIAITDRTGRHTGVALGATSSTTQGEVIHSNGRSGCYLVNSIPSGPTSVIPSPRIHWNGGDVTNQTSPTTVGQQMPIYATIDLPSGVSISSQSWSVPGITVAGWPSTQNQALPPVAPNLSVSNPTFYWVDGGNSRQITYTANLSNGAVISAVTTFNVLAPSNVSFSAAIQNVAIGKINGNLNLAVYNFPALTPGIVFNGSISAPPGPGGTLSFVQVLTNYDMQYFGTSCQLHYGAGLDSYFPLEVSPFGVNTLTANDSPGVPLFDDDTEVTVSFGAIGYLLWQVNINNSIPVPLASIPWSWNGDALYVASNSANPWQVNTSKSNRYLGPSTLTTTYPSWNKLILIDTNNFTCH